MTQSTFRKRARLLGTAVLSALVLVGGLAAPALAAQVNPTNTSYDRPGITALTSGDFEIAWAGSDANGSVNFAQISAGGAVVGSKYTYSGSSTFQGTGITAAFSTPFYDRAVLAWTDVNENVHVALANVNSVICEGTGFGSSADTPYLTFDSAGNLHLTTVDSGAHIHVTDVSRGTCSITEGGSVSGVLERGGSVTIANNSAYTGAALVDLSQNGTPDLWLAFAGTNSAHNINIGHYTGSSTLGTKYVESNHATITDMGATGFTNSGGTAGAFFTYCGTNHVVYGQPFYGNGVQPELTLGGSCSIFTNSAGYVNGGVDVAYNGQLYTAFPNQSNYDLYLNEYNKP